MFSHSVLKRFVKDYSLPIQLIREPYFDYYINLYDNQYNTKEKYQLLCDTVATCGSEDNFMNEYHRIKDDILNTIKSTEAYSEFINGDMNKYAVLQNNYSRNNIFNESNVGKYFISIDLKKANFQAMKSHNPKLVLGANTYDEFMNKFTDLNYMIESKYIRQVIFGNMNPKRQIKIQQFLTNKILNKLLNKVIIESKQIKMVSPDEIVFEVGYLGFNIVELDNVLSYICNDLNLNVEIEYYKLEQIKPFKFFVKQFVGTNDYELMCIPGVYAAQVYKIYNGLEINDYDKSFFYENQVAKFEKSLLEIGEVNVDESESD